MGESVVDPGVYVVERVSYGVDTVSESKLTVYRNPFLRVLWRAVFTN